MWWWHDIDSFIL